jgi:hypothetical protein
MLHPDAELRWASEEIGLGVFATREIPQGTIVWVLDELDRRLKPEQMAHLGRRYEPLLERYGYLNAAGEWVLCWDLARWINHSCDANTLSSGWELDVAIRDIAAGEEITNDYGSLNLGRSFACRCGAAACRRRVRPADFERLATLWDARVRNAFPQLMRVPQPLWSWVPNKRTVAAASRRPERVPSISSHRLVRGREGVRPAASARRSP